MARIVGYIAASLDGFIATSDESLEWLFKRGDVDLGEYGFGLFIKSVRAVATGCARAVRCR